MQDDFEEWPPRLIIRTDDPALGLADVLPASIAALLLRSTKLKVGLEVLEFDGMADLRLIARKLVSELGPRALLCRKTCTSCQPVIDWQAARELSARVLASVMGMLCVLDHSQSVTDVQSLHHRGQHRAWSLVEHCTQSHHRPCHAGLQLLVQDYVAEVDGGVLHQQAPSVTYFEANNMDHDVLHGDPRALLQQRVRNLGLFLGLHCPCGVQEDFCKIRCASKR